MPVVFWEERKHPVCRPDVREEEEVGERTRVQLGSDNGGVSVNANEATGTCSLGMWVLGRKVQRRGEKSRAWLDVVSPKRGSSFNTLCVGIGIPGRVSE